MMDFTFPYSTCEKPQKDNMIQQPYSTIINLMTVFMLAYFMYISKSGYIKILFFTYILFELWHTMSHMVFIGGNIHQIGSHILAYIIAFATLFVYLLLTKTVPSVSYLILLLIIVIIDIFECFIYV